MLTLHTLLYLVYLTILKVTAASNVTRAEMNSRGRSHTFTSLPLMSVYTTDDSWATSSASVTSNQSNPSTSRKPLRETLLEAEAEAEEAEENEAKGKVTAATAAAAAGEAEAEAETAGVRREAGVDEAAAAPAAAGAG
jgi:hypothetical protein